jgi:hypothetical protein
MADNAFQDSGGSALRSWLVVFGIAFAFLLWGFLVYYTVGDKGAPAWDFGVVQDIPGQSPYSTHQTKRLPHLVPPKETGANGVIGQHVKEGPGKTGATRPQGGQ